ncbi:hypothetical protein WKI65_21945 [Streptomyces sp. MS1.AVA.3]|uniref:hypothetical protein n=1 Tax=Streptomyces decoyicus TaxID=249567 RepID=UPI0030BF3029
MSEALKTAVMATFYCRPGIEGMIGYFRRNHLTPVPEADSLAELNEMVDQWDLHDGAPEATAPSSKPAPTPTASPAPAHAPKNPLEGSELSLP